ncbi:DUF4982 domain-containing protein [Clostridium estertheticum]|uniref:beta-galactosidase GalA n=1 Tax=Clostridium estertheticum TaxID=238834 RepID=UPI0013E906EC|nr:beta-galactosidase GalA [Clostridium estertheticum]MBZ9685974.1 DUF4982 domain-containing protein [Clostridium estertheticum]
MQYTTVRAKEKFDSEWQFHKGDIFIQHVVKAGMTGGLTDDGEYKQGKWMEIAFVDKTTNPVMTSDEWAEIDIPHDWCIEGNYVNDKELGSGPGNSGYLPVGIGYYRKEFKISEEDKGKKICIEFDGVMRNSTVWVNGHLMGTHFSGYTGSYYDITDVVRYGDEGDNVILVRVDATTYEGWWYEGCGIYRHVWLTQTDRLHVERFGTYVTTPKIDEREAEVTIITSVGNEYPDDKNVELVSKIVDAYGEVVASLTTSKKVNTFDNMIFEQIATVKNPKLWCPKKPYLYKVVSEIKENGSLKDVYETTFGIRTIEFTVEKGFFLNGEHMPIKGVCCHQDFAGVGVALPDSVIEYKIGLLKEMGCNAYRSAHNPPTPELLDICDRMGIMVMDENRKLDSSPDGIANLKSMLYRDRNHPCIIMWSMENEEILEGTVMGSRILDKLARIAHKIDPTRPVTAAMNHGWNDGGYSDAVDIVGYNYGQRDNQDTNDHKNYPNRRMIGSESASCTTTRGIYENDSLRGYCSEYGTLIPEWSCSVEKAWRDVIDNPFLTGVFIWTGFDYRGEPTPYKWPCINSHFGVMDTCGFPKENYYYLKSAWTDEPMVHIMPHWSWTGKEGQNIDVWVYSNCQTVELFLNGKSLGEKEMIPNSHLEWKVEYVSGELTAIGKKSGVKVVLDTMTTTGQPAKIKLEPHKTLIKADGVDVSMIRVEILDSMDRVVPIADNEVVFTIEGGGRIIGVGNGNPSSHEPDKSNRRRAFNGYCLVIVQALENKGDIIFKASSQGLNQCEVLIAARL